MSVYAASINRTVYASKPQKTNSVTAASDAFADSLNTQKYAEHLNKKYGNVRLESIGRDQESLDRVAKTMSGNDVIIAPNIFKQMADDPQKAAYYEKKIDGFFAATPRLKAHFAAKGMTYEPCGVVVHEDGSVTYICGGGDSPERVAEVNAINRAKHEKQARQQRELLEQSLQSAQQLRMLWNQSHKVKMTDFMSEKEELL